MVHLQEIVNSGELRSAAHAREVEKNVATERPYLDTYLIVYA